jgi:hypothetical protein
VGEYLCARALRRASARRRTRPDRIDRGHPLWKNASPKNVASPRS